MYMSKHSTPITIVYTWLYICLSAAAKILFQYTISIIDLDMQQPIGHVTLAA
jgi:hypothetical protein